MKPDKAERERKKRKKEKKKRTKEKKGTKKKDLMAIDFNEINVMMGTEKKKKAAFKPIKDVKK